MGGGGAGFGGGSYKGFRGFGIWGVWGLGLAFFFGVGVGGFYTWSLLLTL